jgi:hypothetical protein
VETLKLGAIEYDLKLNLDNLADAARKVEIQMAVVDGRMDKALTRITRSSETYAKRAKIIGVETQNTVDRIARAISKVEEKRNKDFETIQRKADEDFLKEKARSEKRIDWIAKNSVRQTTIANRLSA